MSNKPLATIETESILCDDQKTFHLQFSRVSQHLRMRKFAMFETSEDLLDQMPPDPNSIKICYIDWNLKTSKKLIHGDLIRELVTRLPNAKIVVISTSDDEDERRTAKEAGAIGWVVKTNLLSALRACNEEYQDVTEFTIWE